MQNLIAINVVPAIGRSFTINGKPHYDVTNLFQNSKGICTIKNLDLILIFENLLIKEHNY